MRQLAVIVFCVGLVGCRCGTVLVQTPDSGCSTERCDGLDNDCDGSTDEGFGTERCGVGACATTVELCTEGQPTSCTPLQPTLERCDGVDNDCDGATDEQIPDLLCGVGSCTRMVAACSGEACVPGQPSAEVCDGEDNDCDGDIDEDVAVVRCGVGACERQTGCSNSGPVACVPGTPSAETCNAIDDDCDGMTDEGLCLPPTVSCPAAVQTRAGDTVTLAASATPNEGALGSLSWTVQSAPPGSRSMVSANSTPTTTLTPDVDGAYQVRFCANDEGGRQACCVTTVTASSCTAPPSPPASTACMTSWDGRPIFTFASVPSGVRYELATQSGQTLATASTGQNWLRPAMRIDVGAPPPGKTVPVGVRACRTDDPACCSTPTALTVQVVEACSTPVPPTSSNVVLSEYLVDGEGPSCTMSNCDQCQSGEAVELTNLSNCPVTLEGTHFAYRNNSSNPSSYRWMNFGANEIIPPRGVYVAIRNRANAPTCAAALRADNPKLFGLKVSTLAMEGLNLCSGWFNNTGGGSSEMQLRAGTISMASNLMFTPASAIARIAPYQNSPGECETIGFNAVDSCGSVVGGSMPTDTLSPNQLGRLWHPCDAVRNPVPACVRD